MTKEETRLSPEVLDLSLWIQSKIDAGDFGEINVSVKTENGAVSFIERGFTEKLKYRKSAGAPGGSNHDRHTK